MESKITSRWEEIDPETATKYLETMDGNRAVRQVRIDHYANQMRAGLWRKTHQGIAFDAAGHLVDGQHRMWAIVESKVTVTMMVSRGLSPEDVTTLDGGLPRGYADVAHYAGWKTDPLTGSIARVLVLGIGGRARMVPFDILQQWYQFYEDGIDFALKLRLTTRPTTGKSINANMTAAFARAFYTHGEEPLTRMGEVLRTGQLAYEADRAAFVLRDAWLSGRLGVNASEQYAKTEGAIRAFVERRAIKTLQRPEGELFKLPPLPKELRYETQQRHHKPVSHGTKQQAAHAA